MAKRWHYTETPSQVGLMICTACRQKIVEGKFRYRATEDAYLPQHQTCCADDPAWTRIANEDHQQREFHARRIASLAAFIQQYGEPDQDDIEDAAALTRPLRPDEPAISLHQRSQGE